MLPTKTCTLTRDEIADLVRFKTLEQGRDPEDVFRADCSHARGASASSPRGHLHIDGTLRDPGVLGPKQPLGRVHFPCRQPTLEAAVVLLADEFGVPTNVPHEVWSAAVAEHEARPAQLFDG
jgi:hypothetical protein